MVLLLEDERDDIAGVGSLMTMVCSEAQDGKLYGDLPRRKGCTG